MVRFATLVRRRYPYTALMVAWILAGAAMVPFSPPVRWVGVAILALLIPRAAITICQVAADRARARAR